MNNPKLIADLLLNEVFPRIKILKNSHFQPWQLAEIVDLLEDNVITRHDVKQLLDVLCINLDKPISPLFVATLLGMQDKPLQADMQVTIDEIINLNKEKFISAKNKPQILGWFVGQVLKKIKADPKEVMEELKIRIVNYEGS